MITRATLDLQIERHFDGSFKWFTSGCRPLREYEPHACIKATALSDKGERFNLLVVIPPDAIDNPDADIVDMVRRAALMNANFPDLIAKSWEPGVLEACVEENKRGGMVQ